MTGVLLVAVVATVRESHRAEATTAPSTLGMRPNGGSLSAERFAAAETWLRRSIAWTVAMADRESPSAMRGSVWGQLARSDAVLPRLADRLDLVLTVPLAFGAGSARDSAGRAAIRQNLSETAAGRWDNDYAAVAERLVAGGYGDAVVRLGHELTGSWYPWSAQGNADVYVAAFRHVHDVFASVAPGLRFEWNAARSTFVRYGPDAYPGDDYVDVIGLDVYYEPTKGDPVPLDEEAWLGSYQAVLQAHLDFAMGHAKPISYAEWANGELDEPLFVERMHRWFEALPASGPGRLLYQSYFNVTQDAYNLAGFPRSAWAYQRLFGVVADGTPMYTGTGADELVHLYRGGIEIGTMTLESVTSPGITVVHPRSPSASGGPKPSGFRLFATDPVLLDISTTASYAGAVSVCLPYTTAIYWGQENPQLLAVRRDGSSARWENVTRRVDWENHVVCGSPAGVDRLAVGIGFNTAPTVGGSSASLDEDTVVTVTLTAMDIDGNDVTFELGDAASGAVGLPSPSRCRGTYPRTCTATVAYRPDADFFGVDRFFVRADDGRSYSDAAWVSIRVDAVGDEPQALVTDARTVEDGVVSVLLTGRDPDGHDLIIEVGERPSHGVLGAVGPLSCWAAPARLCARSVRFTPEPNWSGTDEFTYTIRNATGELTGRVALSVDPVNDAPVCTPAAIETREDEAAGWPMRCHDVDGGPLVYRVVTTPTNGVLTADAAMLSYRPMADFNGTDSFRYAAFDGVDSSDPALVSLTVVAQEDGPEVDELTEAVVEDRAGIVMLSGSDRDGQNLAFEVTSPPAHGTLGSIGAPSCLGLAPSRCSALVRYQSDAGFDGVDTFRYRAHDGQSMSAERTVSLVVSLLADGTILVAVVPSVASDQEGFGPLAALISPMILPV